MIFGVAINDLRHDVDSYTCWHSMIRRCYSTVYQKTKPTYIGCKVDQEWLLHSNFSPWFKDNYKDGWQLDKDLLGDGKVYSSENCCFLPRELNGLFTGKVLSASGVTYNKRLDKYCAQISQVVDGKRVSGHLCVGTLDECMKAYKLAMLEKLSALLVKYSSDLRSDVYLALKDTIAKGLN